MTRSIGRRQTGQGCCLALSSLAQPRQQQPWPESPCTMVALRGFSQHTTHDLSSPPPPLPPPTPAPVAAEAADPPPPPPPPPPFPPVPRLSAVAGDVVAAASAAAEAETAAVPIAVAAAPFGWSSRSVAVSVKPRSAAARSARRRSIAGSFSTIGVRYGVDKGGCRPSAATTRALCPPVVLLLRVLRLRALLLPLVVVWIRLERLSPLPPLW